MELDQREDGIRTKGSKLKSMASTATMAVKAAGQSVRKARNRLEVRN